MLKELETAFGSKDQRLQDSQGHYNVFNLNCTASTAGMASPVACGHLASAGAFTQQSLRAAQRLRDQPKPHLRALVRPTWSLRGQLRQGLSSNKTEMLFSKEPLVKPFLAASKAQKLQAIRHLMATDSVTLQKTTIGVWSYQPLIDTMSGHLQVSHPRKQTKQRYTKDPMLRSNNYTVYHVLLVTLQTNLCGLGVPPAVAVHHSVHPCPQTQPPHRVAQRANARHPDSVAQLPAAAMQISWPSLPR